MKQAVHQVDRAADEVQEAIHAVSGRALGAIRRKRLVDADDARVRTRMIILAERSAARVIMRDELAGIFTELEKAAATYRIDDSLAQQAVPGEPAREATP